MSEISSYVTIYCPGCSRRLSVRRQGTQARGSELLPLRDRRGWCVVRPVRRRNLLLAAVMTTSSAACSLTWGGPFNMAPGEIDGPYSYVALGDSISIDEYAGGPGCGGASLLARNRDEDFPQWRGRELRPLARRLRSPLLASDGGTSRTLLESQLPRLESSGVRPSVVTLTVGGNDLLGAYGDTGQAQQILRSVAVRVGQTLGRLRRLLR